MFLLATLLEVDREIGGGPNSEMVCVRSPSSWEVLGSEVAEALVHVAGPGGTQATPAASLEKSCAQHFLAGVLPGSSKGA